MFILAPDFVPIDAPQTQAEIDAFVEAVMASPELHIHDAASSKMGEHMAALNLVPRDGITHIAIGHGDWDDPANWYNGEIPGDDARVLIPEGVHMTYDHVSDARLFTLRVDGKLEFSTEVDSQMVVDTIVISPSGALQIGTEENPVDPNVNVDIIFANNGAIDTDWDPMLLSRGMIAHGNVEIHGAAKDSHDKVVEDPMAGDTWVDMGGTPEGWAVGDTIVIAGTSYEGYLGYDPAAGYVPPQDEIRVITAIEDGMIFFDNPLAFDHDTPRDDLKTSVANYTRNVSFETEDADLAEVYERGHVMFMHNDDVDVRYAEFHELGRTDKSEVALGADEFLTLDFDTNVKGRYSFHFHRAGLDDQDDPAISIGNAVYGSPGWGFVHHESNAILENNATYDTFGAGYVAENGTETGAWIDNIAIFAQGTSAKDPKLGNGDLLDFDLGRTGDGFWFQGRMVASIDNVAASVNNGFVYFHRGTPGESELTKIDTEWSDIPFYSDYVSIDDHPILGFSGNETFASKMGLYILKANPDQGHDVHSVLEDFTGWNVKVGAELSYTAHYTLKDFDLVAVEDASSKSFGISLGGNSSDIAVIDSTIEGFGQGIHINHSFTINGDFAEDAEYTIVNPTFIDVITEIEGYDPTLDTLLASEDIPYLTPDIEFDAPLTYKEGWQDPDAREIELSGTKTDSLGTTDITGGADDYTVPFTTAVSLIEKEGYYTTSDGQNYTMLDLYFSDRLTGDIYMERHPVLLDENVWVENGYANAEFNGVQDLGAEGDPTIDSAVLWATLTDGQVVLTDEAIALIEEQDEEEVFYSGIGDDLIDGGNGVDTVIYSGNQASYSLILSATSTSIVDRRAGGNGTDQLVDIELLDFDTGISEGAFDLQQFAGTAGLSEEQFESFIELYIAYFNRAPDAVGLNFWGTAFANGTTLEKIATLFIDQDEIRATYPASQSNADFVTAVYNNVLGRIPDQAGFDFWVGVLDAGARGQDQFILSVLQSVQEGSPDREYLDSKIDVGAYFAVHKGMSDVSNASASMALFDGTQAGIDTAVSAIDDFYADALDPSNGEFLMQVLGVLDDPFALL